MRHAYHFNHEKHLQGGLGILPTMAYTIIKALPLKGYLFQASGISKGKDFTSLSI